jgi:pimeloyl-ACP methyl ester carboxylesterase
MQKNIDGEPTARLGVAERVAARTASRRERIYRPRFWAGLTAILAVVAAVLVGDAIAAGPGLARSAQPVSGGIRWGPCDPPGPRLQCARVRVPLNWEHPHGRTIQLAVIRYLATKPKQRIGSLFINPGGPGDTGIGLVQGLGAEIDGWGGGRFDVVSWDPRGTNASTHVRCFTSERSEASFWKGVTIPTTRAASERYARKVAALARRCGKVSGWLLPHISTADTARDLDYLRRLVGDRKLTYVGLSYGTYVGQTYANMFPGRVRAMLLDSIVDPVPYAKDAEARVASQASGADAVFKQFLAVCQQAGPKRCALAGGRQTAAEKVNGLLARLRRGPILAPNASPPGKLTYTDLLVSQFNPLRIPETWPQDATDLEAAVRGDGSALLTEARKLQTPAALTGATTSAAISCADAPAHLKLRSWPQEIARLTRGDRLYGALLGWLLWAPCAAWPVRGQDNYRGPWNAKTKNPILLIGTRYDPATPYINAVRSARRLGNAVLLTLNGYGHVSFHDPSACIDRARVAYLVRLITPRKGTVCQSNRKPFTSGFGSGPLAVSPPNLDG